MQQRPEPHCQAALAAVGCAHAVADGMPGSPDLRLNHLFPLSVNGYLANSGTRSHTAGELSQGCDVPQASAGTATAKTLPHASRGPSSCGELMIRRAGESELPAAKDHRGSSRVVRGARLLGGRYRRAVLRLAKAGASQAVDDPGSRERGHCRGPVADRFEASHCPAPVADGHQPRPRSQTTGSGPLIYRAAQRRTAPYATLGSASSRTAQCGHDAMAKHARGRANLQAPGHGGAAECAPRYAPTARTRSARLRCKAAGVQSIRCPGSSGARQLAGPFAGRRLRRTRRSPRAKPASQHQPQARPALGAWGRSPRRNHPRRYGPR
jgi:hypothetical protein